MTIHYVKILTSKSSALRKSMILLLLYIKLSPNSNALICKLDSMISGNGASFYLVIILCSHFTDCGSAKWLSGTGKIKKRL